MIEKRKFRLVTRSDFDGLVCAMLLKELDILDDIKFVHPKDMQDGIIEIGKNDIVTNLPYVPGCHLCFDHHLSETIRRGGHIEDNHIIDASAPSAARVVFDFYGGQESFTKVNSEIMAAVDKGDSAQFSRDEILQPTDWVLMNFLMDARTGLGRFRNFRISNYQLMMELIDYCLDHPIEDVLQLPDVKERVDLYFEHSKRAQEQIKRCSQTYGNVVVLDLRTEDIIYATNRFTIYAMFADCNISMHILWGLKQQNTVFAIGKSILRRTSKTNVGELCLRYHGGGHLNAGTCQVANQDAEVVRQALITQMNADG